MAHALRVCRSAAVLFLLMFVNATAEVVIDQNARPAFGGVVDYAGVFSAPERRALEVAGGRIARHVDMDMFVATVDDRAIHWSWRYQTNRAMVERVFRDVKDAAERHFGNSKPLTLLVVFKHQPVLYLKTDREELARSLLFDNFYAGSKGAYSRLRDPNTDTYADAAMRYLTALAEKLAKTEDATRSDEIRQALLSHYALLESRDMLEQPMFEQVSRAFLGAVDAVQSWFGLNGIYALLLVFAVAHLSLTGLFEVAPPEFLPEGSVAKVVGTGISAVGKLLTVPLLLVMFAITSADLENLVYLTQKAEAAAGVASDVVTYLDWSDAVRSYAPDLPETALAACAALIALVAAITVGLETMTAWRGRPAMGSTVLAVAKTTFSAVVSGGNKMLGVLVLAISLVIFPGLLQIYFIIVQLLVGVRELAVAWRKSEPSSAKPGHSRPPSEIARASPAPVVDRRAPRPSPAATRTASPSRRIPPPPPPPPPPRPPSPAGARGPAATTYKGAI